MTGQWEQYVEQAAQAAYESGAPVWPWKQLTEAEREPRLRRMRGALAVVGPLIVEDTKQRLVEAAARAVEREDCGNSVTVTIEKETDRQYHFNGDEADEIWADRP